MNSNNQEAHEPVGVLLANDSNANKSNDNAQIAIKLAEMENVFMQHIDNIESNKRWSICQTLRKELENRRQVS